MRTRAETTGVGIKRKNRKSTSPTKKLRIRLDKYSQDFKAKNKERLKHWKGTEISLSNHSDFFNPSSFVFERKLSAARKMVEEYWNRACEKSSIPLDVAQKWFQMIMIRHHDHNSSRHYHNDKLLIFKINLLEPNVASYLVFAIFFQYYEFDVRDFGYVENCDAFNKFYLESGIDNQTLLESVLQLLGDPRFNNPEIENDLLYFQDLDLAIFGASPDEYKMYANQLQKEYVHMDEITYKNMRLKILQTFLTIPNIFSTDIFRNKFEKIARANIENEILELKK